jgi:hypothetical protein
MTDPHRTAARIAAWSDSLEAAGYPDVGDALLAILAGESLDAALGMAPGGLATVHQRQREETLREILAALPPERSMRAASTAVAWLLEAIVRSGRSESLSHSAGTEASQKMRVVGDSSAIEAVDLRHYVASTPKA